MRLVTSNAPSTVCPGFTAATPHPESFCLSAVGQFSQLPPPPPPPPPPLGGGTIGCGMVWNDRISDHGPLVVGSNARTCQNRTLLKPKSDGASNDVWPACSGTIQAPSLLVKKSLSATSMT